MIFLVLFIVDLLFIGFVYHKCLLIKLNKQIGGLLPPLLTACM